MRAGHILSLLCRPHAAGTVSRQAYLHLSAHLQCPSSCEAPCLVCRDQTLQTTASATGLSDTYRPAQGITSLFACHDEKPKCSRWDQAWDGLKGQARCHLRVTVHRYCCGPGERWAGLAPMGAQKAQQQLESCRCPALRGPGQHRGPGQAKDTP